jgi:uncharacterized protein (DUF302 family)
MNRNENLFITQSDKSIQQFVADFTKIVEHNHFIINNLKTMDMNNAFRTHGEIVAEEFDLYMIQVCKPSKASKSLCANPERAILMPKFVHVFSKDQKTQIRYMSFSAEAIDELVPDDPKFKESLAQTFAEIRSMIGQAR